MSLDARTTRGWIQDGNRTPVGWLDIPTGPAVIPKPQPVPELPPFGPQEGDVLLFQIVDNGEINLENGLVQMTKSFYTAAYLSLFGGNEDAPGDADLFSDWWGNFTEVEPSKRYVSETQYILRMTPATSAGLQRLEEAVARDLQWLIDDNIASRVTVDASIPEINRLNINIEIEAEGETMEFNFTENWKAIV